jgi:predicted ArsR family transcriptional regulator
MELDYPRDADVLRAVAEQPSPTAATVAEVLETDLAFVRRRLRTLADRGLLTVADQRAGRPAYEVTGPGAAALRNEQLRATGGGRLAPK